MRRLSIISVAGLISASLFAQPPGPRGSRRVELRAGAGGVAVDRDKVVPGAPYSAQSVTQFTQTLPNGDHIQRTTNASIARDSQGRTRTERSFAAIGPLSAEKGGARTVMIFDPVASKSYVLDAGSHTARSMPVRAEGANARQFRNSASAKTEDLGTQVIQGVSAQGKRITRTIPAGKEGNEKEIDIVTETWYSPDLQVVVMSKTSDPRFGDSLYQLNAITRTEPDPALFTRFNRITR